MDLDVGRHGSSGAVGNCPFFCFSSLASLSHSFSVNLMSLIAETDVLVRGAGDFEGFELVLCPLNAKFS